MTDISVICSWSPLVPVFFFVHYERSNFFFLSPTAIVPTPPYKAPFYPFFTPAVVLNAFVGPFLLPPLPYPSSFLRQSPPTTPLRVFPILVRATRSLTPRLPPPHYSFERLMFFLLYRLSTLPSGNRLLFFLLWINFQHAVPPLDNSEVSLGCPIDVRHPPFPIPLHAVKNPKSSSSPLPFPHLPARYSSSGFSYKSI